MSAKNKTRMVNVKGESTVSGSRCKMEKNSPDPHTITIPPVKACTTGTTLQSLSVSLVEDNPGARVFCKRIVGKKVIRGIAEGTAAVWEIPGQVGEAATKGAIVSDAAVLRVTGGSLMAARALVFGAVDTKMACGVALKTMSVFSRNGFWAQVGITRCNSRRV